MRNQQLKRPDVAVIEAIAITEDGGIIPTTSLVTLQVLQFLPKK